MAQNIVYQWEQRPDYVMACRTVIPPGGPTAYNPPRRRGVDAGDVTDFQVGQAHWSVNNLPNVLYQLLPDNDWETFKGKPVPQKVDANGNLMWERWPLHGKTPRRLRYFPVLANIDQICTQEHPLIIEAWRRLDPRIDTADITMRMQWFGRPSWNTIQQRCGVFWRPTFHLLSWHGSGGPLDRAPNRVLYWNLNNAQRRNNTTRGATPGLINPAGGPSVPIPVLNPDQGFSRRYTVPGNLVGLTRDIMPGPGEERPQQTRDRLTRRYQVVAVGAAGRTGSRGQATGQDTGMDSDSDFDDDSFDDDDDDQQMDKGSESEDLPASGIQTSAPAPPTQEPSGSGEITTGDTYTHNANEYLLQQGLSPLRAHEESIRQHRARERQEPTPPGRGTLEGWRYPTELLRGNDPFAPAKNPSTQQTPAAQSTVSADYEDESTARSTPRDRSESPDFNSRTQKLSVDKPYLKNAGGKVLISGFRLDRYPTQDKQH